MMKSRYSVGLFVGAILFALVLSAAYKISYDRQMTKMAKEEESISIVTKGNVEKNKGYYICELNGYLVVYLSDKKTLYEMTDITMDKIPDELKKEIKKGKYIENEETLYGILENYSS